MFTGIVRKLGRVEKLSVSKDGGALELDAVGLRCKAGDSIAVLGVCSTVVSTGKVVSFEYMPETLERSKLRQLKIGETVNLEESVRANGRLDGHIVLGHVDTIGIVEKIVSEGSSRIVTVRVSDQKRYMKFVVEKGSIAVDGVSLTIASVRANRFVVKIIPYTWEHTAFKECKKGSMVNLEFDIIAKYLEKLCK